MATNVGSIEYDARINTTKMRADAARAENTARSVGKSLTKNLGGAVSSVASSATQLTTGLAILGAGFALLGKSALNQTSDFQQARIAFDTMLGSAEAGQKMMAELSEFAKKTPFNLPQVVQGAKSLLAYGIEAKKIVPTFNALGNIASGVGRDKLPQLTLAFGQVMTAGKLTGMELRQFTEAGVPLLAELAKQSGKSAAQIKEDMENGMAPSFEEVEKAIFAMTERGGRFYNLMQNQSMTFAGRMSNIMDSVNETIRGVLGVDVQGNIKAGSIFDRVTQAAEKLMIWLEQNKDKIINYVNQVFTFIEQNGTPIAIFVGTILTAAFLTWAAAVVKATWPILLVAAGITAIYIAIKKFKPQIDSTIQKTKDLYKTFKPLSDFMANNFKKSWENIRKAAESLSGALGPLYRYIKDMSKAIAVFAGVFLAPYIAVFVAVGVALSEVVKIISGVIADIAQKTETIRSTVKTKIDAVINYFESVPNRLSSIKNGISTKFTEIKDAISVKIDEIKNLISTKFDSFKTGLTSFLQPFKEDFLGTLNNTLEAANTSLSTYITETTAGWVSGWQSMKQNVTDWANETKNSITNWWAATKEGMAIWWQDFKTQWVNGWNERIQDVKDFFSNLQENLKIKWEEFKESIKGLWQSLSESLRPDVQTAGTDTTNNFVDSAKNQMTTIDSIRKIGDSIVTLIGLAVGASVVYILDLGLRIGGKLIEGFVWAVKGAAGLVWGALSDTFATIGQFFGGVHSWLWDAGAQLIQGFINGITSKVQTVKDTLSSLTNMLPDWKGPLSVDKVLLKNNGQAIIDGFVRGMESRYGVVQSSLGGLTNDLSIGAQSIGNVQAAPSSSSSITVNVNMSGIMARSKADEREIAKSLVERINEELRAKQLPELGGGNL